jgi:copper chaperone CopZ
METTNIKIAGMTCANCAAHVEKAITAVPGVKDVRVALNEDAVVKHEGVAEEQLLQAVQGAGDYRGEIIR